VCVCVFACGERHVCWWSGENVEIILTVHEIICNFVCLSYEYPFLLACRFFAFDTTGVIVLYNRALIETYSSIVC
jgi:hypothetical protein